MEGAESALLVLIFLCDPGKDFVMFALTCFFFFLKTRIIVIITWLDPNILFNFNLDVMSSESLLSPALKKKQLPVTGAALHRDYLILVLLCFALMTYLIISLY